MQTRRKLWWIGLAVAACGSEPNAATIDAAGPGDASVAGQTQDADAGGADTAPLDADAAAGQVVKVDFLWMIDHSGSMAHEQRHLAKAFAGFAKELASAAGGAAIDAQIAVVSVQQVADSFDIKKVGAFVHSPAKTQSPAAIERVKMPCAADADCAAPKCSKLYGYDPDASLCPADAPGCITPPALPAGDWMCKSDTASPQFNNNYNCSVNTHCQLRCNSDKDCYGIYEPEVPKNGKHLVYCNTSSSSPSCMFPPATEGCPDQNQLPAVLKQSIDINNDSGTKVGTQLDWFRCSASLGTSQSKEAQFEGGFRSMWTALDPKGINCPAGPDGKPGADCQYQQLVRPDAYLVLVAISDDDDCSYAIELEPFVGDTTSPAGKEALQKALPEEARTYCQQYGDRVAGNVALLSGYCQYMKSMDKSAGKPTRTCPTDCAVKSGPEKANCQAAADKSIAQLVADNPSNILQNNNFASIGDFAGRFKSLKADPSKVLFATMTGDTLTEGGKGGRTVEQQREMDRASYYRAILTNQAGSQAPYICSGPRGEAGYGSRYIGMANEFGSNGFAWNICKGATLDDGMTAMAKWLRGRVQAK